MEDGFDSDPKLKSQNVHELLGKILKLEEITSARELQESQARYCIAYYGDEHGKIPNNRDETITRENRRIRRYVLRSVVDWLYPTSSPKTILECGSAGDASAAMEFPNTHVDSVDEDVNMFRFNLIEEIPTDLFKKLGQKKPGIVKIGMLYPFLERGINELISKCLPNLSVHVEDANKMSFPAGKFDMALVQGTPDMLDFLPEMSRTVKPGGYIVSVVYDDHHLYSLGSAYESRRYNGWREYGFKGDSQLKELGLRRLETPELLRKLEHVHTYRDRKGNEYGAGVVIEAFEKE